MCVSDRCESLQFGFECRPRFEFLLRCIDVAVDTLSNLSRSDGLECVSPSEFQRENALKLRSQQITFSQRLTNYSNQFESTIKELFLAYEQLKSRATRDRCRFQEEANRVNDEFTRVENYTEVISENRMIETVHY
jgi:hypothetical protein